MSVNAPAYTSGNLFRTSRLVKYLWPPTRWCDWRYRRHFSKKLAEKTCIAFSKPPVHAFYCILFCRLVRLSHPRYELPNPRSLCTRAFGFQGSSIGPFHRENIFGHRMTQTNRSRPPHCCSRPNLCPRQARFPRPIPGNTGIRPYNLSWLSRGNGAQFPVPFSSRYPPPTGNGLTQPTFY